MIDAAFRRGQETKRCNWKRSCQDWRDLAEISPIKQSSPHDVCRFLKSQHNFLHLAEVTKILTWCWPWVFLNLGKRAYRNFERHKYITEIAYWDCLYLTISLKKSIACCYLTSPLQNLQAIPSKIFTEISPRLQRSPWDYQDLTHFAAIFPWCLWVSPILARFSKSHRDYRDLAVI